MVEIKKKLPIVYFKDIFSVHQGEIKNNLNLGLV